MFISIIRNLIHYGLHFIFPALIAVKFYRSTWFKTYIILLSTMFIDLDHLLAKPVFDPHRCSIGFHPLHSYIAFGIYLVLLFPKKTRLLGIGLSLHWLTDLIDCLFI
jgi:hypothetical protein